MISNSSIAFSFARWIFGKGRHKLAKTLRSGTSLLLVFGVTVVCLPPLVIRAAVSDGARRPVEIARGARNWATAWSPALLRFSITIAAVVLERPIMVAGLSAIWPPTQSGKDDGGQMPPRPNVGPGVSPQRAQTKQERLASVVSLRINPAAEVVLQSHQPILFSAIPIDAAGSAIHALSGEWESSDQRVVSIRKSGKAVAGHPGNAILTATAGRATQTVRVTVLASQEEFGGKKKQDSTRASIQINQSFRNIGVEQQSNSGPLMRNGRIKRQHSKNIIHPAHANLRNARSFAALLPLRNPNDDPLPDNETSSLYQAWNAVGFPSGKTRRGALTPALATGGTENGISNFSFALPIASLPGRGIDASLSLVYNSQTWHKSTNPSTSATWMTYDVDSGWPATGFRISFGQIEDQGSAGFTLTDPDGTRHALIQTSSYNYDTIDGTFIHFYGASGWGTTYYPNGTQVYYYASGGGYRSYPVSITDRNGNEIWISYAGTNGVGPKIASITDTLQRHIYFYYASNGDLVAITAPGLTGNSDLQMMRFYYTDVSIGSGLFGSGINTPSNTPSSVHTLQYVYLPSSSESGGAHIGYKFEYSSYGMIYKLTQFRGMTVSTTSTSTAGTAYENDSSSNHTVAATTTYDYPGTPINSSSGLSDVPKYAHRTDEWAGRTTSGDAPSYTFEESSATNKKILKVTAPDGAITETDSNDKPGQWDDGLVIETKTEYGATPTVLLDTIMDWEQDSSSSNPRVYQVRMTNVPTGLTKATVLSYTTYNNVSAVSERAFTTNGSVSSTVLRRTETSYQTSSNYLNRHIVQLPTSVKVYAGTSTDASSRIDYAYDNYGSSHADMTARADIVMHDDSFDPFVLSEGKCEWDCVRWHNEDCIQYGWVCPYVAATDYRGNVTSVTTYSNATDTNTAITHAIKYDIAGNVTSAQVDCCQLKTFSYTDSPNSHTYAYPVSQTTGPTNGLNLTVSATYDLNTGLIASDTDENLQVTTNYYNTDSLRVNHVNRPSGGGASYFYYGDGLLAHDNNTNLHYYQMVSTTFGSGSSEWADVYRFFDGRGAVAQSFYDGTGGGPWNSYVAQYDNMGRVILKTNPFSTGGYGGGLHVGSSDPVTVPAYDKLGRVTSVTMPSGDDTNATTAQASTTYDQVDSTTSSLGLLMTGMDQAGKLRREKVDALGRVVRLDESTGSGLGSESSPQLATFYEYDVLDNLVHINQGSQDRYFKYDSLSRVIRERQAEQTANSNYNLGDPWNTSGSWTRQLSYNSSGLVTEADDARGTRTQITYDGLNRVTQIEYKRWDNSAEGTPTAHYYYDSMPGGAPTFPSGYSNHLAGRLAAMTYGSSATGDYFGYDTNGRITQQYQVTGSTTYSVSYAYNLASLLTSETYPNNDTFSYTYGYGGKLASVSKGSTTYTGSLTYASSGALTSETFGNSMVHSMTYNRALQPSQVKLKQSSSGSELQRYDYLYGEVTQGNGNVDTTKNNGQIARIDGTINGSSSKEWDQRFVYDELGRLSSAAEYPAGTGSSPSWKVKYNYDRFGNRKQSGSTDNAGVSFTTVTDDDIVSTTNRFINTGSTAVSYDDTGNITQDMKFRLTGSLGMKYAYDANGRQISAKLSDNSNEKTSVYDCRGRRVQTTVGGTTRTMVYDIFGQAVADYNGSTLERENLYRGGQLLSTYETSNSAWKYVLSDAQGSTRAVMSAGGSPAIVARHDYLPFGEEIPSNVGSRNGTQGYGATDTNRQKYGLTERDDTTGLDHTWFRKYESFSGRWTSPDPLNGNILNPQSLNHYAYALNDSPNLVDPSGLLPVLVCGYTWINSEVGYRYGCAVRDVPEPGNPGELPGGGPGGAGPRGNTKRPCPTGEALAGNATVKKAVSKAFDDSKSGTKHEHEEGGYIWADKDGHIITTRVAPGPLASAVLGPMSLPAIDGYSTPSSPAPGFGLVGYFHTHPYGTDQPVHGRNSRYNPPDVPSGSDNAIAKDLGVPGLIGYKDSSGKQKIEVFGPERNSTCY